MKKILLVEDELSLLEMYRDLLEDAGYQVVVAVDGLEAEKKMKAGGYDLVLLDLMLPEKDGIEVLNSLSEGEKENCGIIVALSNLDRAALEKCGYEFEVEDYLLKTDFNPDEVVEKVESWIGAGSQQE